MYTKGSIGDLSAKRNCTVSSIIINGYAATIQYVSPTRTTFGLHTAAKQFPEASEEDRAALRSSIVANGFTVTQPIIVYAGKNEIVEGRTRWSILQDLKYEEQIPVAFVEFPDDAAAKKFALAQNLGRRHLTREQRDEMMNTLILDGYEVKDLAAMFGVSESLVTKITTEARIALEDERNMKIVALIDEGKKQTEVAEIVGVNAATVSRVMQKRNKSEIAQDGKNWFTVRPDVAPVVKPTEIDPLKITGTDADEDAGTSRVATKAEIKLEKLINRRVESSLKVERRALEKSIGERIEAGVQEFLQSKIVPTYTKRIEMAEKIIATRTGIMSKKQYRLILSVLHPDNATDADVKARMESAFKVFSGLEPALLGSRDIELAPIAEVVEEFVSKKKNAA